MDDEMPGNSVWASEDISGCEESFTWVRLGEPGLMEL
jgi:hypothetical protein